MFAVVDILGQQFKVEENKKYYVPKLQAEPESEVTFDSVIVSSDEKGTKIGNSANSSLKVHAKVLEHLRDDKVLVFKKKRRKTYQKMNGHRQHLSRIEITKIG